MLYNMLCAGRITGPAGHRRCEFIRCKRTPHSGACLKLQEWSCRVEGFDPASFPRKHKELKDLDHRSVPWLRLVTVAKTEQQRKAAISDARTRAEHWTDIGRCRWRVNWQNFWAWKRKLKDFRDQHAKKKGFRDQRRKGGCFKLLTTLQNLDQS